MIIKLENYPAINRNSYGTCGDELWVYHLVRFFGGLFCMQGLRVLNWTGIKLDLNDFDMNDWFLIPNILKEVTGGKYLI